MVSATYVLVEMGRRRKKVVRVPRRKLPKVFLCPVCGKQSIDVEIFRDEGRARIRCGSCGLAQEMPVGASLHEVDVYSEFADRFYRYPEKRQV